MEGGRAELAERESGGASQQTAASCRQHLPHLPRAPLLQGWRGFTTGAFQLHEVEGHHLWPLEKGSKAAWLQIIADQLAQLKP